MKDLKVDKIIKTNQALRVMDMASVVTDESIVNKVRHKRGKGQRHSRDRSTDSSGKGR